MLQTTTPTIEGRPIQQYLDVVTSEAIGSTNSMLMVAASGTAVII
ncbi:MAG: heavy metal-binding domain-containing protein [Bacteroidaceae bacterium]|nr:heavy metal-binding domain-containing protein [Bacteroidaceae bacterium]